MDSALVPSIINDIHLALAALVQGRAHPVAFVEVPTFPAIRYTQIACEPQNTLNYETNLDRTIWRVDVFSGDYPESMSLARQVRDAMVALGATCESEVSMFDEDVKVFQRALDFEVWIERPETQ